MKQLQLESNNAIIFLFASLWILVLNIPVYQRVIFFVIQLVVLYITFYEINWKPRLNSIVIVTAISTLSIGIISISPSNSLIFFAKFWPNFIWCPIIVIPLFFLHKIRSANIGLAISLIQIFLYKSSFDPYTLINLIDNGKRDVQWISLGVYCLEIILFAAIPLIINNNIGNNKIKFDLDLKKVWRMTFYFVITLVFHQEVHLIFKHSLYIPKVRSIRELILYFGTNLLTISLIEEILYRGFLYNSICKKTNSKLWSLVLVSIFFGVMHFQFGFLSMLFVSFVGLIFGKIYQETDSLIYPIIFHSILNLYL